MKSKFLTPVAMALFALSFSSPASAIDGHEQAAESAAKMAAESEMETTAEKAMSADTEMAHEAEMKAAESSASAETKETEASKETAVAVKTDSKESFEEKVEEYNKDKKKKDKVVCRREKKTGSHFSRRRCVTVEQAEREREDAQDALQRASRGSNAGPID